MIRRYFVLLYFVHLIVPLEWGDKKEALFRKLRDERKKMKKSLQVSDEEDEEHY